MALTEILAAKRQSVDERKLTRPLGVFRYRLGKSRRNFHAALAAKRNGFILECKRASPSQGTIRVNYDPASIAANYARFADAISVLTDAPFFQGSMDHLRIVSERVKLPVLCKDFVLDAYQVYEARHYGADAILLMLSVLDDESYGQLSSIASSLDMDVLTEVHTESELDRATRLGAKIIGINNRNLVDLTIDHSVVETLAPKVPTDRLVVCESGISNHAQVTRLAKHVDAFLVGSALMREPDLRAATTRLIYGRLKICGLTRIPDAQDACQLGASHGGLIFVPRSPRVVAPENARALVNAANLEWVGVFANEKIETILRNAAELGLAAVQVHGDESDDYVLQLRRRLPKETEIWRALPVIDALPACDRNAAERVLLDTAVDGRHGGTGKAFDWNLLQQAPNRAEVILSGGISPRNIARADKLGCWALDVSSGVESSPGIKSPEKLRALVAQLRGSGRNTDTKEAVA